VKPFPKPTQIGVAQAGVAVDLAWGEFVPMPYQVFGGVSESHDAPEALALIEQEVMGLVVRILCGGERQESQPTEAPAPERQAAQEPAKKPMTLKVGRETAGRRAGVARA
jgi:hypothetical protein